MKLDVLGVEIESGVRVVGHVKFHPFAHGCLDACLYFLVEIEECVAARSERQCRIVGLGRFYPHVDLHRALRPQTDSARAENLFKRSEREIHVENVERLFAFRRTYSLGVLLPVVLGQITASLPVVILLRRENERRGYLHVANPGADNVTPRFRIIFRNRQYVRRHSQVVGAVAFHKVLVTLGDGVSDRRAEFQQ